MIPQTTMSPSSLKNEFFYGNEKIFTKYNSHEKSKSTKNSENENEESIVQWKENNIKDGFVIVDEAQLTKLIKREPIERHYKVEEPFATGLFTSVRRCQSLETGESYAAKFTNRYRYGEDCSAEIYHEIALLSLCGSAPRVIQIHDIFENDKEIIIVMEYAPGGDLQTIIDEDIVPFESDVMSFIKQTVEGLEYLHRRRIAHLDIKPQNIVMMGDYPNCEIKLCDFEISRVILEGKDVRELLGTPDYVAPEILHYDPITLAADMWSLGVTTYVLLSGYSPFGGDTDQETFCNISRAEIDFPDDLFKGVSNEAIDFMKSLLLKNPKARLTASACLKHPWLNSKPQPNEIRDKEVPFDKNRTEPEKEGVYDTRNSCETCENKEKKVIESNKQTHSDKALRKYLSKSREALFDKVVQKHNNNNIRKNIHKNHRFRKNRLCESHISLISKSQEKLLVGENFNLPSRSIEKLYGLRSLSKSQEVLSLYKNGGILASQESLNLMSELIKSRESLLSNSEADSRDRKLMRATTADLGVLHQRNTPTRMYSYSSTTSLASFTNNNPGEETEDDKDSLFEVNYRTEDVIYNPKETKDPESNSLVINKIEKLENNFTSHLKGKQDGDEEEPKFTVAQLISAFNKHQEVVTKNSLEVTMSAQEKKVKTPQVTSSESKTTFPTGPTALRLFIPDIDLVEMPKKFVPKYKMRFPENTSYKDKTPSPIDTGGRSPPIVNLDYNKYKHISTSQPERSRSSDEVPKEKPREFSQDTQEKEKLSPILPPQRKHKSRSTGETHKPDSPTSRNGFLDNQKSEETVKKRSPTPTRKLSTSSRKVEKSPSVTRKSLIVEKSPLCQRKSFSKTAKPEGSSQYKIVGYGEKNENSNKKTSGVSYKIEFDSPVVTRKFPIRNTPTKGTISSNLKMKEIKPMKTTRK